MDLYTQLTQEQRYQILVINVNILGESTLFS